MFWLKLQILTLALQRSSAVKLKHSKPGKGCPNGPGKYSRWKCTSLIEIDTLHVQRGGGSEYFVDKWFVETTCPWGNLIFLPILSPVGVINSWGGIYKVCSFYCYRHFNGPFCNFRHRSIKYLHICVSLKLHYNYIDIKVQLYSAIQPKISFVPKAT